MLKNIFKSKALHLRNAAIVVAYCHVLNAAKICLQAINKGSMAALFEMWPKKGLFYVIIGHVVIQKIIIMMILGKNYNSILVHYGSS